jgi:hypothetical protein
MTQGWRAEDIELPGEEEEEEGISSAIEESGTDRAFGESLQSDLEPPIPAASGVGKRVRAAAVHGEQGHADALPPYFQVKPPGNSLCRSGNTSRGMRAKKISESRLKRDLRVVFRHRRLEKLLAFAYSWAR